MASMPVTGSSRRNRSGSAASARARNTRRRWPPESRPICVRRWPSIWTCTSASSDGAPVVAARPADRPEPREAAHHHDVLDRDRECPVHELRLGHVGDAAALAARRRAEDLDPPRPRLEQAGHELEQRALARAVGPDDREQAAGLHGERHVLERDALAVARRHVAQPHVGVGMRVRGVHVGRVRVGPLARVLVQPGVAVRCRRGRGVWVVIET